MKKTLTFFALNSPDGKALQEMLIPFIKQDYQWKIETDGTLYTFMHACNHDDVVVLDATMEHDGQNNYSRVSLQPMVMDNILVVSRTYLPMNYPVQHEGGAPLFPYPYAELDDTNPYATNDGVYSNETIMRWLREKLPAVRPRSKKERGFFGSFRTMNIALNQSMQEKKDRVQIFISYRSRGVKEIGYESIEGVPVAPDDLDLRGTGRLVKNLVALKKRIRTGDYHEGIGKSAYFVMPGVLAYPGEILTKLRRWQVLSLIEDWIRNAEEFWIYDTKEYIDSWWTQGELVLWAYLDKKNCAPRLRLYNYQSDTLTNTPSRYIPTLTNKQFHTIDRLIANTNPETMSADAAEETFRVVAEAPILNRISYFKDPVWDKSFWTYPLLQCQCTNQPSTSGTFDVESFLSIQDPVIPPDELANAVQTGKLTCPNPDCGRIYRIIELPPRYRWVPARGGKFVKAGEETLDVHPTYRAIQV